MKLGKRIGSASLAFLMGFTMIPENIPKSMAESAAVQSTQTIEPKKEI